MAGPEPVPLEKEIAASPVAPEPSFDGWYFGLHGGAIFNPGSNHHTFVEAQVTETSPPNSMSPEHFYGAGGGTGDDQWGGEGGVQAGRNFQRGSFVFGLEADFSGSMMENDGGKAIAFANETSDNDTFVRARTTAITAFNWYMTARPRLGYVLWNGRMMAFGTGGLAVGQTDLHIRTDIHFGLDTNHDPSIGWTGGGGVEFYLSPHVNLTLTYLYIDVGGLAAHTDQSQIIEGDDSLDFVKGRATSDLSHHVLQAGVSFKF